MARKAKDKEVTVRNFLSRQVQFKACQYLVENKKWAASASLEDVAKQISTLFDVVCTNRNAQGLLDMAEITRVVLKPRSVEEDIRFIARCLQQINGLKMPPAEMERLAEMAL